MTAGIANGIAEGIANGAAWAVVVAAGRGERFGVGYNKVFHPIRGRSVLSRCLDALAASGALDGAVLVLSERDIAFYERLAQREGANPLVRAVVAGGASRQQSVLSGLRALPGDVRVVAVHDAARPFASPALIRACVQSAREVGSGVPATPVRDTIHEIDGQGRARRALARDRLCAVQTPQAFLLRQLLAAHERYADQPATDDAALYQRAYGEVHLVMHPDCERNIKITTPRDAESAAQPEMRVGTGHDAHRLVEGRPLVLCGVRVPFEKGLLGHSDADVACHALMDALLGAMALGDIGRHFPDRDPQYEGISSIELLRRVAGMMRDQGYSLANADVTIVAQRPRLVPHMAEMAQNLAHALGVGVETINVKATTTEGMGFEGEGLGMSAQAAALIRRG
ncbi:MAG: 2-C-methyl-D-erythritol 2,4-cyclodiphosphate synthase [Clostridiales bacterium]|nr:2-C-methyl-D-erythritol 2,4-cyclodiphosphate synthase [Clostridiales bacterium]